MRKIFVATVAFLIFSTTLAFFDVDSSHSNQQAIDYLAQHAVLSGYSSQTFRPGGKINRAEIAKLVTLARGIQPDANEFRDCFPDVAAEWFAPFVCFAKNEGWLGGYSDGSFRPANQVNRAEAAKILLTVLGVGLTDSQKFDDVVDEDWFAPFAQTIRSRQLLEVPTFSANNSLTRGEAAEMIFRILVLKNSGEVFFDSSLVENFDFEKSPSEILTGSIDFPATAFTNLRVTKWWVSDGFWSQKPILEFNGKSFEFSTPQDYAELLRKIQKHFEILGSSDFDEALAHYISEFETITFSGDGSSSAMVVVSTSATSSTFSATVSYAPDFTNVDLENETAVAACGGALAEFNDTTIYAGYESLPPINLNPVLVSFTNGEQDWVRRDYETSADESVSYGLLFADAETVFAVFTSRGVEESSNYDFRRFAKYGWLSEYGEGEGNQIAVIAKINPANGDVLSATFLSARLDSGETSSLTVKDLQMSGKNLVVSADCWHNPRRTSRQPMDQKLSADNSPFDYMIEFTPNLQTAVRAEAPGFGQ